MLEIKYVIPFITLLIGGLIGNWLALGRDKRKEFNEAASPLFETLEIQRSVALSGSFPVSANETDKTTFIQIKRKITFCKRKGFEKAIDKYVQAKNECKQKMSAVIVIIMEGTSLISRRYCLLQLRISKSTSLINKHNKWLIGAA